MAAAIVAPMTAAMPFEVELTIPDARIWMAYGGPGAPNTQLTAPYIVLRVTGDTQNILYPNPPWFGYLASKVRIEIPGVVNGTALDADVGVFAYPDSVRISSPASPSVLDMGARASFPEIPGYAMETSLGPIATTTAQTYHWGPTSGYIPFTSDDGVGGTVSAGFSPGGMLKITIGGNAPNPLAARPYTDLAKFLEATGPNRIATFEEGSGSASGGITFPDGLLTVVETASGASGAQQPHAYWFGTMGTPSHFALNATGSPPTPNRSIEIAFPEPVLATGLVYNCYDCAAATPGPYGVVWTTREADGTTVEHGTTIVDYSPPTAGQAASPGFFGLTTTRPFRRLTIMRVGLAGGIVPWMIDDVRYATTLPAVEYRHAGFDHYFVTSLADELTKLDEGTFTGWARTGLKFNVGAPGAAGTNPVCRLFSASFAPKSSHFYSSDAAECELRKADPHWQFEGTVFSLGVTDASGACAAGTTPLYRLYNDGQGGAPNHRYTTSVTARQAMVEAGWIPEGAGALGVIGCVLQ